MTNNFFADESGAVTVDWVVLTAAIIGLGVAVTASVGSGSTDLADDVQTNLTGMEIVSYLPPVTYGEALISNGWATAGSCTQTMVNGQAVMSCSPSHSEFTTTYEMSNGEIWSQTTSRTGNEDPVVVWENASGEVVDAPEAT